MQYPRPLLFRIIARFVLNFCHSCSKTTQKPCPCDLGAPLVSNIGSTICLTIWRIYGIIIKVDIQESVSACQKVTIPCPRGIYR